MNTPLLFGGSIPENYDRYLGPILFEPYAADLVGRIPEATSVSSVLEIACGTGRLTRQLRAHFPDGVRIVASDLSEDMLAVAKKVVSTPGIEWMAADAQALPFPDASFDLLACQFGLMFVPDLPKAFAEFYRVLKPNGALIFNTWDTLESNPLPFIGRQVVTSWFKADPPSFYDMPFAMHDPEVLRDLPTQAGFSVMEVVNVRKVSPGVSAEDAAIGIIHANPIITEIVARDEAAPAVLRAQVEAALAQEYGGDPLRIPMSAWVVTASKPK